MEDGKCEKCKYYSFIDSGYGYCRRFPPNPKIFKRFPSLIYKVEYPVLAWCANICGEFIKK